MNKSRLFKKLKSFGKQDVVLKDVDFKDLCTFKCGGKVSILVKVKTLEQFIKTILFLYENNINYVVLGAGSNILCSDRGYDGVVLKLVGDFARIESLDEIHIQCGAGVRLSELYAYAFQKGLSGVEKGAGIPATIGGATFMNAGAYGFQMSDIIEYVVAFVNGKITYFTNSDCEFAYRHSVFQKNQGIILRVGFVFEKKNQEDIRQVFLETMQKRRDSQPLNYPSAGSVFKKIEGLQVSKMLDECGMKGLTLGDAQVSKKHANFIINLGNATAHDIYYLINIIKIRFKRKTSIELETEIQFLGEFDEDTR